MFNLFRKMRDIATETVHRELGDHFRRLKQEGDILRDQWRTCETCGCLVDKEKAVSGESEVRKRGFPFGWFLPPIPEVYIYTPYFCKKCAPPAPIGEPLSTFMSIIGDDCKSGKKKNKKKAKKKG